MFPRTSRFDQYDAAVLPVPLVRLDPELPVPRYAKSGDAGIDLMAREEATVAAGGGRALVPTGVAVAIPNGYGGFILPRSGLALRHGLTVVNAPGLVDAGYRGELMVVLLNTDPHADVTVQRGERIAQLVLMAVEHVSFVVVEDLAESERGSGGWGHTGR